MTRSASLSALVLVLMALIGGCATSVPVQVSVRTTPTLSAVLRPRLSGGEVEAIDVRYVIQDGVVPAGEAFSLVAPVVYDTVEGIADRMIDLKVEDADGPVVLTVFDDPVAPGGSPYYRHWRADRGVRFPVRVSYSALVQPAGARGGPPLGIRPSAGGVSGAGSSFLLLPDNAGVGRSRIHWELGGFDARSLAASSFGDGDFDLAGAPDALLKGWYMAGPAGRYPATGDADGFSATWLGRPPWDVEDTMAWSGRVYADLARFFQTEAPRYRVFVRVLATPPFGGGTAMTNSFLFSRGPLRSDEVVEVPKRTLVHEMIHGFVGGIEGPRWEQGWFAEGLTSHYTSQLQLRGGYITLEAYLREINQAAEEYYTNPARNWSAERIASVGFDDARVRRLPYVRGQLYFAALDARVRTYSDSRRDLDTVMREVFARRDAGERFDNTAWREIVEREAGPGSAAQFDAVVLQGTETLIPPPGMLAPCLAAEPAIYENAGAPIEGYRWIVSAQAGRGCGGPGLAGR